MLRGRFGDTSRRPFLEGKIYLPRLNIESNISFLVDTGADRTILMPDDTIRSGIDVSKLHGCEPVGGVGGTLTTFHEHALLVFSESKKNLYLYKLSVLIAPLGEPLAKTPSLLGRDILDRWRMTYSPATNYLSFKVVSADVILPLSGNP